MALITCPDCGKQVSSRATSCPNCGCPITEMELPTTTYKAIVYGDADGDGRISAVDYVKIKNYIMGSSSLSGAYKIAADVNRDGNISAVDYVNIKNYIMGNSSTLR